MKEEAERAKAEKEGEAIETRLRLTGVIDRVLSGDVELTY